MSKVYSFAQEVTISGGRAASGKERAKMAEECASTHDTQEPADVDDMITKLANEAKRQKQSINEVVKELLRQTGGGEPHQEPAVSKPTMDLTEVSQDMERFRDYAYNTPLVTSRYQTSYTNGRSAGEVMHALLLLHNASATTPQQRQDKDAAVLALIAFIKSVFAKPKQGPLTVSIQGSRIQKALQGKWKDLINTAKAEGVMMTQVESDTLDGQQARVAAARSSADEGGSHAVTRSSRARRPSWPRAARLSNTCGTSTTLTRYP